MPIKEGDLLKEDFYYVYHSIDSYYFVDLYKTNYIILIVHYWKYCETWSYRWFSGLAYGFFPQLKQQVWFLTTRVIQKKLIYSDEKETSSRYLENSSASVQILE